jgi:L-fuculose-phosphate aldolase
MEAEWRIRRELAAAGRRLPARGFVAATDGNLSARLSETAWVVTPAGCCLGELDPTQLLIVTRAGGGHASPALGGPARSGSQPRPTSEWALHRTAYDERPDIGAVVHAHPPYATALSVAGLSLAAPVLPEVVVMLGSIPTAPYATPSSAESAAAIRELVRGHDALLLDRHGAVTLGATLEEACLRMEKLEHCAQIVAIAQSLGRVQTLTPEQIEKLVALRASFGLPGRPPTER